MNSNIILLSIDALRADHCSFNGYGRDTTPFLDKLAKEHIAFEAAISASSHTREAVPALLSGRYPDVFAANGYSYVPDTVADRLSEAGYRTGAFHSNPYVSRAYGFDSGFDIFDDDLLLGKHRIVALLQRALDKFVFNRGNYHVRAEELNQRSLNWLASLDRDDSFFLWNHYMDPHGPYNPPQEYSYSDKIVSDSNAQKLYQKCVNSPSDITPAERELLMDCYDGEIRYLDEQLEVLFNKLIDRNLLEDTLIIITADHGDAFGEHGYYAHPRQLHDSLIRVPLIILPPDGEATKTASTTVSTLDVVPTIHLYADVHTESESLPGLPLVGDDQVKGQSQDRIIYAMVTGQGEQSHIRRFAARSLNKKVVMERDTSTGEVKSVKTFTYRKNIKQNLSEDDSTVETSKLEQELKSFSDMRLNAVDDTEVQEVTEEESNEINDRLEALGYK